jgi:YD repeat-containing protein
MYKYLKCIILFLWLVPLVGFAQQAPIIIPPSPEASSVFKFTEIPVSLYTGMPDITIPLYTIQAGDIHIPISLSYHGRGMKVEEIASHVGMGWSLNYGGMISRQIRGMADDAGMGYLNEDFYNEVFTDINVNNWVENFYIRDYSSNGIDLIPDIYFFDIMGNSGKFFFDQTDKSVVLQHFSDTRIKCIKEDGKIKGWIVTDNAGNKYYFGSSKDGQRSALDCDWNVYNFSYTLEGGGVADLGHNTDRFTNTWHLMEIETPDHEFIEFKYEEEIPIYYRRQHDKNDPNSMVISYFSKIWEHQYQISEIDFTNGKIKFTSSDADRKDFPGAHALDKIEIFDKNNRLIKRYKFQYLYPQLVQDNNQLAYLRNVDSSCNYRLFLHSVQEGDSTGQYLPPYIFSYNTNAIPNRFSTSQDKWGYYNGKPNGQFMPFFNYSQYNVNRDVDTTKAKAGLLEKITYPDGGSVSFILEQNMYSLSNGTQVLGPGKRIKKIQYYNGSGLVREKEYAYVDPATSQSSGILFSAATPDYVIKYLEVNSFIFVPIFYPSSSFPLGNFQDNNIGYSIVTEYNGTAQSNAGKTEYEFTTTRDAGTYDEFPFPLPVDNEWLRGKPLTTRVYEHTANGYVLRKEIANRYTYAGHPDVEGMYSTPFQPMGQNYVYEKDRTHCYLPLIVYSKDTLFPYNYDVYYQMGGTMDLYSTTVTEYPGTGSPVETQTNQYYNYDKYYLASRTSRADSRGDSIITDFYYPPDIINPSAVVQALTDSNRISEPLRVENITKAKTGGAELSRITHVTQFRNWGNGITSPELLQTANNSNPLETTTQFYAYDAHGNPTEIAQRDGIHTVYLWGYSSQYPVAKVTGSNYNTVKSFIDQAKLDNAANYTDAQIRDELNKIRTGLAGVNAQVWTYTYAPLLGISSETDPGGHITYYEYDSFGRLSVIRDGQEKILKKYDYHYPITYYNTAKNGTFTRNCSDGYEGSSVTYTVPDSTYSSTVSQLAADQLAQDDVDANGQAYANAHGTCTLTIYATLTTSAGAPIFESGCLNKYSDITIHFYQDAAHTTPYSVSNLQIQLGKKTTPYVNGHPGSSSYDYTTYTCNGTSYTLSHQITYHACTAQNCFPNICLPDPNDPYTIYSFFLVNTTYTLTQ